MSHRSGSIVGPVVLIVFGAAFLLRDHFPSLAFGQLFLRYWPVLLILWGLIRLVEFYTAPAGQARSGLSTVEVSLLLVGFLLLGFIAFTMRVSHSEFGHELGIDGGGFGNWGGDWMQERFPFSAKLQQTLKPGEALWIQGQRGDVVILPSGDGQLNLEASDQVAGSTRNDAQNLFQRSQPVLREDGGHYVLQPAGNENEAITANLRLQVPPTTPIQVEVGRGDLQLSGWKAAVSLSTQRGAATVNDVQGDVHVSAHHDSVRVERVSGRVEIDGNGDDVTLADIQGPVTLSGDFSGSFSLERLAQGLQFTSSRSQLSAAGLSGSLTGDRSAMRIDSVDRLSFDTRDKEIEVNHFRGALHVRNAHGSVSVTSDKVPQEPLEIVTSQGEISLTLPAASEFALDASARRGSIESQFPVTVNDDGHLAQAHGRVGSKGPQITLETSDSTITLRKAGNGG